MGIGLIKKENQGVPMWLTVRNTISLEYPEMNSFGETKGTVEEISRDQNHFFVDNFANISNKKLKNVSFES